LWEEWRLGLRKFTGSVTVSKNTSVATKMPRFQAEPTPLITSRVWDATVISSLTSGNVRGEVLQRERLYYFQD
jgi:hypothetical protein